MQAALTSGLHLNVHVNVEHIHHPIIMLLLFVIEYSNDVAFI